MSFIITTLIAMYYPSPFPSLPILSIYILSLQSREIVSYPTICTVSSELWLALVGLS